MFRRPILIKESLCSASILYSYKSPPTSYAYKIWKASKLKIHMQKWEFKLEFGSLQDCGWSSIVQYCSWCFLTSSWLTHFFLDREKFIKVKSDLTRMRIEVMYHNVWLGKILPLALEIFINLEVFENERQCKAGVKVLPPVTRNFYKLEVFENEAYMAGENIASSNRKYVIESPLLV